MIPPGSQHIQAKTQSTRQGRNTDYKYKQATPIWGEDILHYLYVSNKKKKKKRKRGEYLDSGRKYQAAWRDPDVQEVQD